MKQPRSSFQELALRGPFGLFWALILLGCGSGNEAGQTKVAPPAVNLPPTPSLEPAALPEFTESGSYTIHGLLSENGPAFGTGVRVEGTVAEVSTCEVKEGDTLCPPAFVSLVDGLENPGKMVLVVLPAGAERGYQEGEGAIFSGTFQQWSDDKFYVRSAGLVQVAAPEPESESN